ncbi:MAG TPA: transketolase C-terminal domain-containing protein [Candidatus Dojkabacteria bacterium]|nr:transketolase C-terminal domain-containing protein [Candidatus Dojkabacteria bacterium]
MKYSEAITKAVEENLGKGNLYLFGQDIRLWGGQGGVFKGLFEKFPNYIFDTPISEAATSGIATGMAMSGKHALVEYAFLDFILHSADNIVNNASKIAYLSNGKFNVPLTYYATINSERGYGATHSQPLEYMFTKVPGLTVVYPSNSTDAYSLLTESIERKSPTLFLNHKLLHENTVEYDNVPTTKSRLVREGDQLTIVSYGRGTTVVLEAVKEIDNIEIIDLRYLNPLDWGTIKKSVSKTNSLLVVDEGYGSTASDIVSTLVEEYPNVRYHKLTSTLTSRAVAQEVESSVSLSKEVIIEKVLSILKQ